MKTHMQHIALATLFTALALPTFAANEGQDQDSRPEFSQDRPGMDGKECPMRKGQMGANEERGPQGMREHHPGMVFGALPPGLLFSLDLKDDQIAKLKEYRYTSEKKQIELRAQKEILQLDFQRVVSTQPLDLNKLEDIRKRSVKLQEDETNQAFADTKYFLSILTPEQQKKLANPPRPDGKGMPPKDEGKKNK